MLNGVIALAVVCFGLASLLAWLWRRAEARLAEISKTLDELSADREQVAASLSKELKARKRQAEELAGYRKRADKARKRNSKSASQPLGTAARIADFEAEVEKRTLERDQLQAANEVLGQEILGLSARLEQSKRDLESARAPVAVVVPPTPSAAATSDPLEVARAELAENRERCAKLEEQLEVARQTEARMRKRMENQEQLYASMRGELDVKKDRLRTQEEQLQRLQALKVALTD